MATGLDWKLRVSGGRSAEAIAELLELHFPDATTAVDLTYGEGAFWRRKPAGLFVVGMDIHPKVPGVIRGDFTAAPFPDASADLAILDPPYMTDTGKRKRSVYEDRFSSYPTIAELRPAVVLGCREALRIARQGVIVKVQNHVHAGRMEWMEYWVVEALGYPCDQKRTIRAPMIDPKWKHQRHLKGNDAVYLVYRKGCADHGRESRVVS